LSLLAAVSEIHAGRVAYVGPPFLEPRPAVPLESTVWVGPRGVLSKVWGVATRQYVDRTTPVAVKYLESQPCTGARAIVYVNGDAVGRVVSAARRLGHRVVFMPHNFAPEYLDLERQRHVRRWISQIGADAALEGYRDASLRLCLTQQDVDAYEHATGASDASRGDMYFGYPLPVKVQTTFPSRFTVLVNTNLAIPQAEEGVLFFLDEVWPLIPERERWKLVLAGRHPTPGILARASKLRNAEVVAQPGPDRMEQVFSQASVCVATSRSGSGIKLRVAEALRRGLPVVCSDHCSRGYDQISRDVLRIYRSASECAAALAELSRADLRKLRSLCLNEYDRHLSFPVGVARMRTALQEFCRP
jgi:glycosyltransferase involved in cell wall biosynthesis